MKLILLTFLSSLCIVQMVQGSTDIRETSTRKEITFYYQYIEDQQFYYKNFDSALFYLEKIIRLSEEAELWDVYIEALGEEAYVANRYYEHEIQVEAISKGTRRLEMLADIPFPGDPQFRIRGDFYTMAGVCAMNSGDFEKALAYFTLILDTLKTLESKDLSLVFNTYAYLADRYMKMGFYDKVYEYYRLAEEVIPVDKSLHDYYTYIHRLYMGSYYYRIKDYHKARAYYLRALEIVPRHDLQANWKDYLIPNYNLLSLIYQKLNNYDSTFIYLDKAIKLQNPEDPGMIETLEYYGDCHYAFQEYPEALEIYQQILLQLRTYGKEYAYKKAQIAAKLGSSFSKLSFFEEAIAYYQLAFSMLYADSSYLESTSKSPDDLTIRYDKTSLKLVIYKADALFESYKRAPGNAQLLDEALANYRLACLLIDKFRHAINTDDFKEFFVSDLRQMYEHAVEASYLAYQRDKSEKALELGFYFMEKSKNQILLDAVSNNNAWLRGNIPDTLLNRDNQYRNKITSLQNKLYQLYASRGDARIIKNCEIDFVKTQQDYTSFLSRMETDYPDYFKLKYNTAIPSLVEIRKGLKQQLLIEYFVGKDFVATIAGNRNQTLFNLTPIDSAFHSKINSFLSGLTSKVVREKSLGKQSFLDFTTQSHELYLLLLQPALDHFNRNHQVIIIPDDILCYLPFEILVSRLPEQADRVDYKDLQYLLKDYILSYEYSSFLVQEAKRNKNLRKHSLSYAGFAPSYTNDSIRFLHNGLEREGSEILLPLKYNTLEIQNASNIFNAIPFLGTAAQKADFKKIAASSGIIHLAAHTLVNDSFPGLSGIHFSRSRTQDDSEDETLYINEIYSLKMNAELIILSACKTGTGKLRKGEGIISMGRAFKYAGCSDIVMSLWEINDFSTVTIMTDFCRYLKKGYAKDKALRKAKLRYLRKQDQYQNVHPYYWSAFIIIGDQEPITQKTWPLYFVSGLALLLLALLFIVLHRKRRISH